MLDYFLMKADKKRCPTCNQVIVEAGEMSDRARLRWYDTTDEERSEHARKMVAAREARKAPAPAPEDKQ